jgi:hypothetical protein
MRQVLLQAVGTRGAQSHGLSSEGENVHARRTGALWSFSGLGYWSHSPAALTRQGRRCCCGGGEQLRYPHVFVPAAAFQPLADLRLLTLYSSKAAGAGAGESHVLVHAFCSKCGVHVFRASGQLPRIAGRAVITKYRPQFSTRVLSTVVNRRASIVSVLPDISALAPRMPTFASIDRRGGRYPGGEHRLLGWLLGAESRRGLLRGQQPEPGGRGAGEGPSRRAQ